MARKDKAEQPVEETTQEAVPAADDGKTMDFTSYGVSFEISAPYTSGQVMGEGEAHSLNQTRVENIRNNFAPTVKEITDKAKSEEREVTEEEVATLQSALAEYEKTYVFQGKRTMRAPVDPVKRKARGLARDIIANALRSRNIKIADLAEGKLDDLIGQYLEGHPELTVEAKRQVEEAKAIAGEALSGVDLESMLKPKTTEAPTEEAPQATE